jgi:hypothetical protein
MRTISDVKMGNAIEIGLLFVIQLKRLTEAKGLLAFLEE